MKIIHIRSQKSEDRSQSHGVTLSPCHLVTLSLPRATPVSSFAIRHSSFRKAFSLVEILMAIFILGIGLIMVASVFPVGANWTRQTTEDSVAQTIAQNALAVINNHYGHSGDLRSFFNPDYFSFDSGGATVLRGPPDCNNSVLFGGSAFNLQALPGLLNIPTAERAYQFGSPNPFPAANPQGCSYFWTALVRLNPAHQGNGPKGIQPTPSYKYDLYILVFRKGDPNQRFTNFASAEIVGTRSQLYMPSVIVSNYASGVYNVSNATFTSAGNPPLGNIGIGSVSGTVFRQSLDIASPITTNNTFPRPALAGAETVVLSPPADGTNASPLIYVYQTTVTF